LIIDYFSSLEPTFNLQLSTFNLQPSTFNLQPSTFNHQPSTINHQPSTFNFQPSTFNLQPSTINHQPSTINPHRFTSFLPTFINQYFVIPHDECSNKKNTGRAQCKALPGNSLD